MKKISDTEKSHWWCIACQQAHELPVALPGSHPCSCSSEMSYLMHWHTARKLYPHFPHTPQHGKVYHRRSRRKVVKDLPLDLEDGTD